MALQYELFYAIGEGNESQMDQIRAEVAKLVEAQGGTWLPEETVERRKLAYMIKGETRAVYIAQRFTVPSADERKKTDKMTSITELSRQLELHKSVLRHIIVRAEGLPALGERETVPQVPRPGRRDDRRGGERRPDANQVREDAVDARLARKPEAAPAPVATEEAITTEEKPVAVEAKAEVVEKKAPKKEVAKKKVAHEKVEETKEAPKKRTTRKKKDVSAVEEEIDKKLDEVLNL